jgi:hypothetical protein
MKKLLILTMIIAGSLVASSAYSQVRVEARIGFERDFPGYTYYTYPAWRGHYQDRAYYNHYRGRFHREHKRYFHGRDFDHTGWDHRNDRDRDRDRHDRRH